VESVRRCQKKKQSGTALGGKGERFLLRKGKERPRPPELRKRIKKSEGERAAQRKRRANEIAPYRIGDAVGTKEGAKETLCLTLLGRKREAGDT